MMMHQVTAQSVMPSSVPIEHPVMLNLSKDLYSNIVHDHGNKNKTVIMPEGWLRRHKVCVFALRAGHRNSDQF